MQKYLHYYDIPDEYKNNIDEFISYSSVALLPYDHKNNLIEHLIASGTFVEINSIHGVLTAHHVWEKFRKKATYISFCVMNKKLRFYEKIDHLRCFVPDKDIDVCFFTIPATKLGTIKSIKNFHPIISNSFTEISDIKDRLWITCGFPYEIQSLKNRIIKSLSYFTHITNYILISEDWDIIELDVEISRQPNGLPKSFGGMSGGGIWSFEGFYDIVNNENKFFLKHDLTSSLLAGVNFYQVAENNKVYKIRGVGPKSVYKGMVKLITNSDL